MTPYAIVITTTDSETIAQKLSRVLLEAHLAACVQIHNIKSHYRWEGKLVEEKEFILHIKTKTTLFHKVKDLIQQHHNYDIPEILMTPVTEGNEAYLSWVDKQLDTEKSSK